MTPNQQQAADRLRHFVAEYKKMHGLSPDEIYELHPGHETRNAIIRISDLESLLAVTTTTLPGS